MSNAEATDKTTPIAERARQFAPVVWLLGKVQSGKTSIVRALTQATDAEIGTGFRACTKTARVFDFPARGADHPLPRHARPRRGRLRSRPRTSPSARAART